MTNYKSFYNKNAKVEDENIKESDRDDKEANNHEKIKLEEILKTFTELFSFSQLQNQTVKTNRENNSVIDQTKGDNE